MNMLYLDAVVDGAAVVEGAAEAATEVAAGGVETATNVVQEASHFVIPKFMQGYVDTGIQVAIELIVCMIVAKLILGAINKAMSRLNVEMTLQKFIRSIAKVVVYFVLALVIANKMGFNTSSVVALASVLSAAFALAAQGSLSNLFGGVLLLITKPFLVGDYVSAGGVDGTVLEIGLLNTRLNTVDNKRVSIPNGAIASTTITNFSTEGCRRVDLTVTASYDAPIDMVKKAIFEAIDATPTALDTPMQPFVRVSNYGESSIQYTIRVWSETAEYWNTYFDLMENIKVYFDKNGVEMTYNHMNVHMVKG